MVSSAGVERNALIGDDSEARKRDIPIVQLNPGGILNYKYKGEMAVRASGLPYSILRPVGEHLPNLHDYIYSFAELGYTVVCPCSLDV